MIETDQPNAQTLMQSLQDGLKRNPRGTYILLALSAVLMFLVARQFMGARSPSVAEAHPDAQSVSAPGVQNQSQVDHPAQQAASTLSLSDWARRPADNTSRNLFAVSIEDYPLDPAHAQSADSAKSNATQADQLKERQILIENLRAQASKIALEGVVLGAAPKAWVDGVLVGLGQPIGQTGFRIVKIEARRIFVERDGVQIELSMN